MRTVSSLYQEVQKHYNATEGPSEELEAAINSPSRVSAIAGYGKALKKLGEVDTDLYLDIDSFCKEKKIHGYS